MFTKSIINICNDPLIGKSHYYNKLNDFDNYFIKPYPSVPSSVVDQFSRLFGSYTEVRFFDLSDHFIRKLRNIILNNPNDIDMSIITEIDPDNGTTINYGAVKNLNVELFPTGYIYQYIIAYSKTYDDEGNVIEGNPNGITKDNMMSFDEAFDLKDYTRRFIKVILNTFFTSTDVLPKYVYEYNNITGYITTIVENFYMRFFKEVFEKFHSPDDFYKAVVMIRDYLIPYLLNDIITFIKTYGNNYYTKSILALVDTEPVALSIDYEDYNKIENAEYRIYHMFRYLHNVKNRSQFPVVVLWNSFLLPSDFKNNNNMLYDGFQSLFFVKLVDKDSETFLNTNTEISLEGFSTYYWKIYNFNRSFELFFKVDSTYRIDETNLDFERMNVLIKSIYDNQLNKMNTIQKDPVIGIIDYDYNQNINESWIHVTDHIDNVQNILDEDNSVTSYYAYIMNDDLTRDDLKNYIDNNEFKNPIYLYIDIDKLSIDLQNQDDIDYIESLKKHNIILSAICTLDSCNTYDKYVLIKKYFKRICVRVQNDMDMYILKKNNVYHYDAYIDKILLENIPVEEYFIYKKFVKDLLGIEFVFSHY